HIPTRYQDYSLISSIANVQAGEIVTLKGRVVSAKNRYLATGKSIQKFVIADETGDVDATWFNQPFLLNSLKTGTKIVLAGTVTLFGLKREITSPDFELIRENAPLIHTGRLVPVYPETSGVSSKWLRSRVFPLLTTAITRELLPADILRELHLTGLDEALMQIHFPSRLDSVENARKRLAFDELLVRLFRGELRRREWTQLARRKPMQVKPENLTSFRKQLPFALTESQNQVIGELIADLKGTLPMNRLLQGDVGSGKTVVAAAAMYLTFLNGYRSFLMAPTEILAEQHYKTITTLFNPFGIKVGLQTGSKKYQTAKTKLKKNFQAENVNLIPDILVGTHALIEKKVRLGNVGLVVIDEQHRFGVTQRSLIREKSEIPHVLTMTATPIPRTVALTLYGDLDLSILKEMPKGRLSIKTWVVPPQKRDAAYAWITRELSDQSHSRQVFIVCPFIEPSETQVSVKAATHEFSHLQEHVFPKLKLGLLHGRLKSNEKEAVLGQFRAKELDILVTTPVVEVGIDIPSATIMVIEGADRFGLAQLHQLRGRVGRSDQQSYCLLFTANKNSTSRLKAMEKFNTGAELAQLDFSLRGPGQLYGLAQHGQDQLKIASFGDIELIQLARTVSKRILANDAQLINTPLLRDRVLSGRIEGVAPD
ncbi:MAG: ATP-dependent DNA helicase RecG, partial [Patescibacteria group bacterium]